MNRKILILALFVAMIILINAFDLDAYFTFENLKTQKEVLALHVEENYALSVGIFVLTYTLSIAFLLPIATVLTLSGGFLFGAVFGTLFSTLGATSGAVLAFLFSRYIVGASIQKKYEKQLIKFNKELETNKYKYLFSIRFLPVFPFFLVNFLCGITKLDLKTFIITTYFGIIPGGFVYTYAGSRLAEINSMSDIFTKEILLTFVLLGTLTLIPVIVKKLKK